MNLGLIQKLSWSRGNTIKEMDPPATSTSSFNGASIQTPQRNNPFNIIRWGMSFVPFLPWGENKIQMPTTINKKLKRHGHSGADNQSRTQYSTVRFRPYVSRVPWHTGPRAFLSQMFPRYGNYCGPNWSSGKEGGSLIWDKRPIDWLDFCCYCHDIGYDTHDQAELLKADLAFLECVEKPNMSIEGDAHIAHFYKMMYITGLRTILIPYRQHLLQLQTSQFSLQSAWLSNLIRKQGNISKT